MSPSSSLTIRRANGADTTALNRLASLDSSRVPSGELLVAQVDGHIVAALSLDTGAVIADPFEHTAAVLDSLRAHAQGRERPAIIPGQLGRLLLGRA